MTVLFACLEPHAFGADCNRNGVLDDRDVLPVNPVLEHSGDVSTNGLGPPAEMQFADMDGDGDLDIFGVFLSNSVTAMAVVRNNGGGSFASVVPTTIDRLPGPHSLGDLDGDGDLDVALLTPLQPHYCMVYLNAGDGRFHGAAALPMNEEGGGITAADLDGDGAMDLVTSGTYVRQGLIVFLNLGMGRFASQVPLVGGEAGALASGDLDGDGDVDVAALTTSGVTTRLNDGAGHLNPSPVIPIDSPGALLLEDLDGDGDLDLAASRRQDLLVLLNRGDAGFNSEVHQLSIAPPFAISGNPGTIATFDLDADGRRDLLVKCQGRWDFGVVSFLRNLGGGVFAEGTVVWRDPTYSLSLLASFDPVAGEALIATSYSEGSAIALLKRGIGANSQDCNQNGVPDECDVTSLQSADCDRNGIPDSCQDAEDCNGNGIPDRCDLYNGLAYDCNHNRISDACDVLHGVSADRSENGIPDECEAPFSEYLVLGFEGCPERIQGAPGEEKAFQVFPTLTVQGNPGPDGPLGWSASIAVEGADVESIVFQGLHASTIFDHDADPATPPLNPFDLDLEDAEIHFAIRAVGDDPSSAPDPFRGAISLCTLSTSRKMVLQPNGVTRIARMTVKVKIPPAGEAPAAVRLRYRDGLRAGSEVVSNAIYFDARSWTCRSIPCEFQVAPPQPFLRCDANDDRRVDIADPIWILGELFTGGNPTRTGCPLASDCNGDGSMDISDALAGISYLLLGGQALPAPFPACGTGEDETRSCEAGSTACP